MNGLARFLTGDQFLGSNQKSCRDVESVKRGKTRISRYAPGFFKKDFFEGGPRFYLLEKLLIEAALANSSVEKRLGKDLEANKGAGGKGPLGIIQNG